MDHPLSQMARFSAADFFCRHQTRCRIEARYYISFNIESWISKNIACMRFLIQAMKNQEQTQARAKTVQFMECLIDDMFSELVGNDVGKDARYIADGM